MAGAVNVIRGVVRGKTIEVEDDLNLPDGQQVAITVQPLLSPEEAIRQSFGGWADDAEELDAFLKTLRRDREQDRPELGE